MFWVIILILICCSAEPELIWLPCMFAIMLTIIITIMGFSGITAVAYLEARLAEIKVYETNTSMIKDALYKESKHNNPLIAGSLENIKQSTNLSNYIKNYIEKKAQYNSDLIIYKMYKNTTVLWWFTYGPFISSDVNKLKLLE